ncbi:PREDICTED: kelch domain-containing protein 4-like isoform X1 [Priapulus caudatus]|uniref:Kelch domain-containing protein 4-like isoform X1 n=1 Tax=Priapulus caudatus TaxID=37621 RepID=A0ABM1EQH4_PRICU|nr:PREDICTED: kelch domain-containing protein 4-like isoform X1 [Priapulus caudatus]
MGKKKDKAKKLKGADKTAMKTDRKVNKKIKKEMTEKGEDDIEQLIANFVEQDKKRAQITEEIAEPPSPRCNMSLTPHPENDELLMFGGEFFNGNKTFMYNDLYVYSIKHDEWRLVKTPLVPPPRCSHQAVAMQQEGGQLWIFGGEFASPTQSQFYHYKDLWVYHISKKQWEKINAHGGPSSRSGHRMLASRKELVVFGGFHDNIRNYKYFNDVYVFNFETYMWTRVEPSGPQPAPRSGHQMAVLTDGRLLVYGGYSKVPVKKDADKGTVHSDMFILGLDAKQGDPVKQKGERWKWTLVKQCGVRPTPRCGFSLATLPNNRAVVFGGVLDTEEDDEELLGTCLNDFYQLDLIKGKWQDLELKGKRSFEKKARRRKKDKEEGGDDAMEEEGDDDAGEEEKEDLEDNLNELKLKDGSSTTASELAEHPTQSVNDVSMHGPQTVYDDGVFKVSMGAASHSALGDHLTSPTTSTEQIVRPSPRMNASMAFKRGILYLYGGVSEEKEKETTLSDFYSIDLRRMDEWRTIIAGDPSKMEWIESSESESEEEEEKEEEAGEDNREDDSNEDGNGDDDEVGACSG